MEFNSLQDLINQYINGETNLTADEIQEKADAAYNSDTIDAHQYDYICRLIIDNF